MTNIKEILNEKIEKYNNLKKKLKVLSYIFNALLFAFAILNIMDKKNLLLDYVLLFFNSIVFILLLVFTKSVRKYYDKVSTEHEYLYSTENNLIKTELSKLFEISKFSNAFIYTFVIFSVIMIISLII